MRSEADWAAALNACTEAFGAPNVLINNAGIGSTHKPVHEETVEAMRANFEVNVIGQFLGMKTVIPGMMAMGGGAIVNVASVWGWTGIKNNVAYQTAKAAALMLSKNAAVTYAPHNIRINCVLPGYVDTPMSRTVTEEDAQDADGVHPARPPRRAGGDGADVRLPRLRRIRASSPRPTS